MEKFMFKTTSGVNGLTPPKMVFPTTPDANPPVSEQPTQIHVQQFPQRPLAEQLRQMFRRIAVEFRQSKTAVAITFAAGALFGLMVLGWWVWPVEWTGGSYKDLLDRDKIAIIQMASDLNAYDTATGEVMKIGRNWQDMDQWACALWRVELDPAERDRLAFLAKRLNGYGCQ